MKYRKRQFPITVLYDCHFIIIIIIIFIYCNWVVTRGSGYFTCKQNMKLVTTKLKSGGLYEKHVVATWNLGNHLSICFSAQGNQEKPVQLWTTVVLKLDEFLTSVLDGGQWLASGPDRFTLEEREPAIRLSRRMCEH